MSAATIIGEVDNGWRASAAFPFYAGDVGIRQRDGFVEIAYFTTAPFPALPTLPADGTIDGESYQAFNARLPTQKGNAVTFYARRPAA